MRALIHLCLLKEKARARLLKVRHVADLTGVGYNTVIECVKARRRFFQSGISNFSSFIPSSFLEPHSSAGHLLVTKRNEDTFARAMKWIILRYVVAATEPTGMGD